MTISTLIFMKPNRLDLIRKLRDEGTSFKEIGQALGVTPSRARVLFLKARNLADKKHAWTEGLSPRLANTMCRLQFESRAHVYAAFEKGEMHELVQWERGIGIGALTELAQWLDIPLAAQGAAGKVKPKVDADCTVPNSSDAIRTRCPETLFPGGAAAVAQLELTDTTDGAPEIRPIARLFSLVRRSCPA